MVRAFIPGGAEKMVLCWIQYLSQHYVEEVTCSLLIMQPSKSSLAGLLPPTQVHYFNVWSWKALGSLFALRKWCRKNSPDIIHAHLPFSGIISVLLSFFGVSAIRIYTEHSFIKRNKFSFWLHGFFYSNHHVVHCISKALENSIVILRGTFWYFNKNMVTLYSGIPELPMQERSSTQKTFVIGTACIFRKDKQLPEMVQLMSVLALHFVERIDFCIIGDGPERPELEDALEKTGLKSRVYLPGLVQDLPEYLKRLDFFMMTSRSEGLPLALLEAMQQGCIPVVTSVGGINEVLVPEVGIFFEMEKPEKLIAFLEGIMAMEQDQLSDLRQKTRQIVLDHFSLEKQIPKLLDLYHQTLSR